VTVSCALLRRPPSTPPFPYTTLFRSAQAGVFVDGQRQRGDRAIEAQLHMLVTRRMGLVIDAGGGGGGGHAGLLGSERRLQWGSRSEEHTSELQSRENLVCRLLLEKKK